ncbi:hypothetical protein MRX96_004098 [Rhipicephalus microplus]
MPTTDAVRAKPCNEQRRWPVGHRVWTRSFRPRKRWIPGIMRDHRGKRMVTVYTTEGTERWHILTKCDGGTFHLTNRATPTRYRPVKNFRVKAREIHRFRPLNLCGAQRESATLLIV